MPKNLFSAWVKNVNNERTTTGKKSVWLSTGRIGVELVATQTNVQLFFIHLFTHLQTVFISTSPFVYFDLLFDSYTHYPHPLLLRTLKKI